MAEDEKTLVVILDKMDKETNGTFRYVLADADGSEAITSLYIKKFGAKKLADGSRPKAVKVTIEAI